MQTDLFHKLNLDKDLIGMFLPSKKTMTTIDKTVSDRRRRRRHLRRRRVKRRRRVVRQLPTSHTSKTGSPNCYHLVANLGQKPILGTFLSRFTNEYLGLVTAPRKNLETLL